MTPLARLWSPGTPIRAAGSCLACLCTLAAACDGRHHGARAATPQAAPATVRLTGRVLLEDELLGQPQALAAVGEHLVVLDAHNSPAVHILRRDDGRRVFAFGRDGSGPGEFRHPRSVDLDPARTNRVWIYDSQLLRFTPVDLQRDTVAVAEGAITLHSNELPMQPVWAGGSVLLSTGLFSAGRLARFDVAGDLIGTAGTLPPDENAPANVVQHAYTGTLVARPDRSRFALLNRHADRVEIFDAAGATLRIASGPVGFRPVYETHSRGSVPFMATGEDLRFGYISGAATDGALFALYSGRARRELPGYAFYGTWVHVFDWSGRLRQVFKLDAYVIGLSADPAGKALYATRLYPSPAVLAYELPIDGGS